MKTNADTVANRTPAIAHGIATLDANTKVVENPANATATPAASKIPIADGSGKLDGWVTVALTKYFESSQQTITAAGSLTIAHGLGAKPKLVFAVLVCQTAELNYSIGDEVVAPIIGYGNAASSSYGVSVVPDTTNLNIRFGAQTGAFLILNKTTGAGSAITAANWKIVFRALA